MNFGLGRAHLPVAVLALVGTALGLWYGGYHPRHFGWVTIAMSAWAVACMTRGGLPRLRTPAGVALVALAALIAWTAASMAWADSSRHEAWEEAVRTLLYAATFAVAAFVAGRPRAYARYVAWWAAGITALGLVTVARMAFSDAPLRLFVGGRLDSPLGYANAIAATYAVGTLLLLGLGCAVEHRLRRGAARRSSGREALASGATLAAATLVAGLAVLAQSRGAVPALLVGAIVMLAAAPSRAAWAWRAVIVVGTLVAVQGPLGDVFQTQFALRQAPFVDGADPARAQLVAEQAAASAARWLVLAAVAAGTVGAGLARPMATLGTTRQRTARPHRSVTSRYMAVGVGVALLGAGLVVALDSGNPVGGWVQRQADGCLTPPAGAQADIGSATSHFGEAGTARCDLYRVALMNARDHPLQGVGAGNFRASYVLERRTEEEPRVAHSLPLQLLGELGIVGLALGLVVVAAFASAAWQYTRSGHLRDPAFAGAIAAIAYWLAHASVDWLWQLPGVSLAVVAGIGGLAACVSPAPAPAPTRTRPALLLAAGGLLLAVALVLPLTMSDLQLRRARDPDLRRGDPQAALAAAQAARRFDPVWAEPAIVEAAQLYEAGERERAADAARDAIRLQPRDWSVHYRASGLIGFVDAREGREAFLTARRLNPSLAADVTPDDDGARRPGRAAPAPRPPAPPASGGERPTSGA